MCLRKLRSKLEKSDDANEYSIKINKIVIDTSKFLNNDTSFEINQEILGIRNVFRGTLIKIWTGNNFGTSDDRKHNKIIVKESVLFYNECCVDRHKEMHDEEEQKKRLT